MNQQLYPILKKVSDDFVDLTDLNFQRFLMNKIDWSWRLNAIIGARGVGKTTLLLQHMKQTFAKSEQAMYISLDHFFFSDNRLYFFAETFMKNGGTHLYIDEVHKYKGWAREIKNLYDQFPDLTMVFSGSSIIEILRQEVDLSRRAIEYHLPGLSFREYLEFNDILHLETQSLSSILSNMDLSYEVGRKIKPLVHFHKYLEMGFYPIFKESSKNYSIKIQNIVRLVTENDLAFIEGFDLRNSRKINQLLYIMAANVPFKPNVTALSKKIGVHRNTLVQYLHYLERASLIHSLSYDGNSVSILQKPDKLLLRHPNLAYAIAPEAVNKGSLRESFFVSQLSVDHEVALHRQADFIVDGKYTFEVGGLSKQQGQIQNIPDAYLALDDMEKSVNNTIPLWMFGLLY